MNKGPIAWMAENHVAANLLMVVFIIGGLILGINIKQEVFPDITLDRVQITVPYPGSTPEDVEEGIILKIEDKLSSIDGIEKITSTAGEGSGTVVAELLEGEDVDAILQEIKSEVDRIETFPEDAEKPVVSKISRRMQVISVAVYGDIPEKSLREIVEAAREDLLAFPDISQVELFGVRPYEISIEISEKTLMRYGLTLEQIASTIRKASQDIPAGTIKSQGGEILLRGKTKKYTGREYAGITVLTRADGTRIRLGDIAMIKDGFKETDTFATFDGKPAAILNVYRVGDQGPLEISKTVEQYVSEKQRLLPEEVKIMTWFDMSEIFNERLHLLMKNSYMGLILVLIVLSLFLEFRLAFWVSMGIPISFLGSLCFLSMTNVSINMMSLFAFIMAIGIVVDDAIVIGENVYTHRLMGKSPIQAAIDGAHEVTGPVTFSILTTIAAFMPLLFVKGTMGKFVYMIPAVIIAILIVSLIEAFFILPAHLSALRIKTEKEKSGLRLMLMGKINSIIRGPYLTLLKLATKYRYLTVAVCIAAAIVTAGMYMSGIVKYRFMQQIEGDTAKCTLQMPVGTPVEEVEHYEKYITGQARKLVDEYDAKRQDGQSVLRNISAIIGGTLSHGGPSSRGNICQVLVYLHAADIRKISTREFSDRWRRKIGEIPGAESLTYESDLRSFGKNINIRLSHTDFNVLKKAGERIKKALAGYKGVEDIIDNYEAGKQELRFKVTPEARTLGITETDLARQIRSAFYGAEALRFQRGRNEVKVMVRYPEKDRKNRGILEYMRIRTANGGEIPFLRAAALNPGRGYSVIHRRDGKRAFNVMGSTSGKTNPEEILSELSTGLLPQLTRDYPGLSWSLAGEAERNKESIDSMKIGFTLALLGIYVLMAVPFKSYIQPILVMLAIPFGFVGAIWGHLLTGYNLSIMSLFGMVALAGVLVNDSLILIDFINRAIRKGIPVHQAVLESGQRRFRPIILTSLTTFFGLVPIMSETSIQAKFLVPMALSLGYGILFATLITLLLTPSLYLILEDIRKYVVSSLSGVHKGKEAERML
jgi:multidrug efflux pump subunit AcrB